MMIRVSEDRLEKLEEKVDRLTEMLREVKRDQHQLEENLRSGLGHAETYAIQQAKQEIAAEYGLDGGTAPGRDDYVHKRELVWIIEQQDERYDDWSCEELLGDMRLQLKSLIGPFWEPDNQENTGGTSE